jgi:hypothetical protein
MARTKFEDYYRHKIEPILEHGNPSLFLRWLKTAIDSEDLSRLMLPDDDISQSLYDLLIERLNGLDTFTEENRTALWCFFNDIKAVWKELHPDEDNRSSNPHSKAKTEVTDAIELERFKKLSPIKQEEFVKDLLEDLYSCKDKNEKLKNSVENLKLTLNKAFIEGRYNRVISIKYAEEIMVYMCIRHIAVKDAMEKNKGKKAQYDIFYVTDGKRLAKQFGLTQYTAQNVLKNLVEMGALKLIKVGNDKLCTYKLGHRVRSREGYLVNSFYFTLGNRRVRDFYKRWKKKHRSE